MLLIGAAGKGKTWFLIGVGKMALRQRKKVVHITLEVAAEEVMARYYQSIFSIPRRESEITITTMELDHKDKLTGFDSEEFKPGFSLDNNQIRDELQSHIGHMGKLFENLIVKRFPTRSLTTNALRGYLDTLEITEKFIPDIIILDYPAIMKTDNKDYRISLGRIMEDVRGIAVERNVAMVVVHQSSKAGADARQMTSSHIAEDWSIVETADIIITHSVTPTEFKHGLARLYVSKARTEQDRFGILITQNYAVGQFCLESVLLENEYWDQLENLEPAAEEAADDDGDDE